MPTRRHSAEPTCSAATCAAPTGDHRGRGKKVDLSEAALYQADLTDASLRGAIAHETVFYGAMLKNTILEGARFDGAKLDGARFDGAKNAPPRSAANGNRLRLLCVSGLRPRRAARLGTRSGGSRRLDRLRDDRAGSDWRTSVACGIEASDLFAFVVTPTSLASEMCRSELDLALEHGKLVVPIRKNELDAAVARLVAVLES